MKNLAVHTHSIHDLKNSDIHELLSSDVVCCTSPDNDDLYVLGDKTLYKISLAHELCISSIDVNIDDKALGKPVGLEYSSDVKQVRCAYSSGAIVGFSTDSDMCLEFTAHIRGGLQCMKPSPDEEIRVLITGDDYVCTAFSDFNIVQQAELNARDYGACELITVGWGKKETQFHGKEGKAAAKTEAVTGGITEQDDGLPRISWRGDSSMFAVSFLRKESQARFFKVFNREAKLLWTSEPTDGIESHISWKPSGNLIATSQLFPNKHVVAFFEKNGLKHRELCLPFKPKEIEIICIKWSYDSEVLCIWFRYASTGDTCLQLWTENNYHWYLKQSLKFSGKNPLVYFTWSAAPRAGKRLILLTRKKFMIYSFRWTVDHSRGTKITDKTLVAVVDGSSVLLTDFRARVIPPPMAHQTLKIDETIDSIVFSPNFASKQSSENSWLNSNVIMLLIENNQLALCTFSKGYKNVATYKIEWKVPCIVDDDEPYSLHHFLWLKENLILCSAASSTHSYLCVLDLEGDDFIKDGRVVVSETCAVDSHIEHIVSSSDENVAYVITNESALKYVVGEGIVVTTMKIPESCISVEVIEIADRHVVLSLTSRGRLFVDGLEIARNITSMTVNDEFLLLTTMQHTLISVILNDAGFRQMNQVLKLKPWTDGPSNKSSTSLNVRRIERGSNLIVAVSRDARTILQMPRGNLECIQPRAQLFHIICLHLNELNYVTAFNIMRKERINLNVIYDHDPASFMKNAKKFVDDVSNPQWLTLFLSELREENVMETTYKYFRSTVTKSNINKEIDFYNGKKIDGVCELMRKIMIEHENAELMIEPILTSLVKNQRIPGIEAALRKIMEIRDREHGESFRKKPRCLLSEEALRYLLYLVDVNVLFDIAMGMYDLELAALVASKSLKDPKEYIPMLNHLKTHEVNYMKFCIDRDLKRYESALYHIAKSSDKFNECLEFVCNHGMYAKALKLYPLGSDEYKQIAGIYGDVLMKNQKYYEAGIMFSRSLDLRNALCAFKAAGSWQDVIVVGSQLDLEPRDMQELYQELVSHLSQERRYRDAAEILVTYLKQHEDAVSMLCEGKEWRDAMRIAYSTKRLDLIETHVKPGIQEHAGYLLFKINKNREEFDKQRNRLAIVRQENAARDLRMQDAFGADYDYSTGREVSDLLSDTSSVAGSQSSQSSRSSRSSGKTYRSSKNRRKQERKVLSIKEGSLFEDLALIRFLHILMTFIYADKDEVKLVTQILLNFDYDDIAEKLQNSFGELLSFVEQSKNVIWPKCANNDPLEAKDDIMGSKDSQRNNIPQSLLEPRFMYPPEPGTSPWQLDIFHDPSKTTSS